VLKARMNADLHMAEDLRNTQGHTRYGLFLAVVLCFMLFQCKVRQLCHCNQTTILPLFHCFTIFAGIPLPIPNRAFRVACTISTAAALPRKT
jgi:hypothetical protein